MRTARSLTCPTRWGGGICYQGVSAAGGGVSATGGLLTGGVVSQHALRQTPPCEQND